MTSWADVIAEEAARESPLWGDCLSARSERQLVPVFSALADARYALGLETIYEGYLTHYGRPRLFQPDGRDTALLLGDYLYAHGLVRIAAEGSVAAVHDLAELISICAHLRGRGAEGDGVVWAATASALGEGRLHGARRALREREELEPLRDAAVALRGTAAVEHALAAHAARLG